jgi:hypothetical protein
MRSRCRCSPGTSIEVGCFDGQRAHRRYEMAGKPRLAWGGVHPIPVALAEPHDLGESRIARRLAVDP